MPGLGRHVEERRGPLMSAPATLDMRHCLICYRPACDHPCLKHYAMAAFWWLIDKLCEGIRRARKC